MDERKNPVERALWRIETGFGDELTLDNVAEAAGVSRFHLSRAFSLATGRSVMAYVRARRLSEAARALAAGEPDILQAALSAGYASHEAFTRAFRDQFGATPERVRQAGLSIIHLQEPIRMTTPANPAPLSPTFIDCKEMQLVGINEHYVTGPGAGIPAQWQRFGPYMGTIPGQVYGVSFGVVHNYDDEKGYDYMCAVETSDPAAAPPELARLKIPAAHYAVFRHEGHVSSIASTIQAIWMNWLPNSDHEGVNAPSLERYGPEFNPITGMGGVEIWAAVKPR